MNDFLKDLRDTVENIARDAARSLLNAALTETQELQRKADALICDASVAAKKWAAIDGLVAAAAKASQDSFLASAARTEVGVVEVQQDVVLSQSSDANIQYRLGGQQLYVDVRYNGGWVGRQQIALPRGRYTAVLSLYRQDADGEAARAMAALRGGE